MRACEPGMRGSFLDMYLRHSATDMAYVDELVMRSVLSTLDGKAQESFGLNASKRYDSGQYGSRLSSWRNRLGADLQIWCPMSGQYWLGNETRLTQLVPYNLGESNCRYLFGDAETSFLDHLMNPENGLILHKSFAKALDEGEIIVVPASRDDIDLRTKDKVDFSKDKEPYKLQILDQTLRRIKERSGLDGRILQFRNENRPSKRYLWFLAIMTVAQRHRAAVLGWEKDREILGTKMWASPGEYVRRSTMHGIMRRIAFAEDPD
jgi:hypothetical protein